METVVKVGRSVGGGVCRAAGVVVRGARRILAAIPLLGISADDPADESSDTKVTTGGEEAENATSPTEDKSAVASPTESAEPAATAVEAKEEEKPASTAEASPEEKKEAPSSPIAVPTPVPVEAKKEEIEKEVEKTVEVSRVEAVVAAPVEVTSQSQPIVTPSIIERKTSEDFPSLLPSSPPPTPIDPSPLQQAQQAAANASALAEALKLPAETITQCRTSAYVTDDQKNQLESNENESLPPPSNVDNELIKLPDSEEVLSEPVIERILVEELETLPASEADLVIQTEEGPIPVTSDIQESVQPIVEVAVEEITVVDAQKEEEEEEEEEEVLVEAELIVTGDESLPGTVNEQDNDAETEIAITEIPEDESLSVDMKDESKTENTDDEIPPPLPESPIPMPKASTDLLNFMTSQIEDTPALTEIIKTASSPVASETSPLAPTEVADDSPVKPEANCIPPPPAEVALIESEKKFEAIAETPDALPPPPTDDDLPLPPPEVAAYEQVPESVSPSPKSPIESLLTPPRSPSPANESSQLEINGHNNKNEDESNPNVDSVKQSLNSHYEPKLKDRLAETLDEKMTSIDRSLKHNVQKIEQSIAEPEAPIENNTVTNDSTTETIEEAPKCQLPSVPAEAPVTIAPVGPAITEDVASVTKAIEEIDINEKAVAAAVNENIESINKNEIIADMNHQNKLNE